MSGSFSALALIVYPFTVKKAGIALGYVSWTASTLIAGWAVERFGLVGVTQQS